jgi:hypothetical protein
MRVSLDCQYSRSCLFSFLPLESCMPVYNAALPEFSWSSSIINRHITHLSLVSCLDKKSLPVKDIIVASFLVG